MSFSFKTNRAYLVLMAAMILAFGAVSAFAQGGTSSIRGTVSDSAGKVIAGASVTVTSETKSFSRTQITNNDGQFVFVAIPPDKYKVEVSASGFKKSVATGVQALVDTPTDLNLSLEVGQVSETVTVSGGEEALNTTNASIGNTFDGRKVIELPLYGRNTPDLLSLQNGVTPENGSGNGGAVNGGRSDQANVTLDGVDVNEQQGGRAFFSVLRVTPEALQEFRVTTTNPDANVGRSSGAQISLVTRSGSNEWHGSGYYYFRPKTLWQANDYFNNINGVSQPSQARRNYGGSFLGPIIKDKWFFSAFYERFEEDTEEPVTREVPLPTLGQGIVRYRTSNGSSDAGCPAGTPSGVNCLTPAEIGAAYFAANGVNPGVNGTATAFLLAAANRYTANDPGTGDGLNTSGFRFNAKTPKRFNTITSRIDGKLTSNQEVFVRGQYQFDNETLVSRFPDTPAPTVWTHPTGVAAGHTWTINSNMLNKFSYGLTRNAFSQQGDSADTFLLFRFIYQPFSFSRTLSRVVPVHNFVDDFTWVKGNHTMSFGGNIRLINNRRVSFGNAFDGGTMNPSFYDNSGDDVLFRPSDGADIFPLVSSGSQIDLRDALTSVIGRYSAMTINLNYGADKQLMASGTGVPRSFKTEEYELYAQDSWRLFNNLTLNYGLRWSTSTPVYEANGIQVAPTTPLGDFFNQRVAGANAGTPFNGLISVDVAGKANNKPGYYPIDWNNVAPSVSVAWSPNFKSGFLKTLFGDNNKSTIRGGFRMVYDRLGSALAVAFDARSTLGFASSLNTSANTFNLSSNLGPLFNGTNQNIRAIFGAPIPGSVAFPLQTPPDEGERIEQSLDANLTTPVHYSFNLSYGRELWKGLSFEASYVGRMGRDLLTVRDVAHFNNLKDPASGQDFYSVMNMLLDLRAANTPITSAPANIAWFNKFVPGLADIYSVCGVPTALTATQAAYRRVARGTVNNAGVTCIGGRNTNDYTFVQTLWDDGLGFGNNIFVQPQYATFAAYSTVGTSDYHAAQFSIRKRFSAGLAFDFNYTYAHSLDTSSSNEASGSITGLDILNPLTIEANRGSSDFDVRHLINANFVYELPFGRGKSFLGDIGRWTDMLVGGWQMVGIYRWNTGFPLGEPFDDGRWATNWNVQSNGVRLVPLASSATPTGNGGLPNLFSDQLAAYRSFRNARPGEYGDRNILREPNFVTLDLGIFKKFAINENHKITFRLEVFNVTNTQRFTGIANFRLGLDPNVSGTPSADFGRFTGIQGKPRVTQIAVRYDF